MSNSSVKNERKKPKLVRDSFTIPKNEYAAIEALKTRAIAIGHSVKKSELLRAGLLALQAMTDAQFKLAVGAVPQLKTGRPAADAGAKDAAAASAPAPSAPKKASTAAKPKVASTRSVSKPGGQTALPKARPAAAPAQRAKTKPRAAKSGS